MTIKEKEFWHESKPGVIDTGSDGVLGSAGNLNCIIILKLF